MKTLVVIPTYNEKENLPNLVPAVLAAAPHVEILVVDDSSPDGTADWVAHQAKSESRLHLLLRKQKEGLGRAYIAGFQWGIAKNFEAIVEMDADFSHRPQDLVKILDQLKVADFVVGSRYVTGGSTVNWGLMRKLISRGGSVYSRLILGFPLNDWTGGFNAWRTPVLKGIGLDRITSNGYSFQIELKFRASQKGFKGSEAPITFEDRRVGQSKMSMKIVLEALYRVWLMRFS